MHDKAVILIARVSDESQRKALPAQQKRLEEYAEDKLKLPYKYYQFDESAHKEDRRKFEVLIEQNIKAIKGCKVVVFDKIDRFTRDASQSVVRSMGSMVERGEVDLHFPHDNLTITKDSPASDLFRLGIGMLLAKYYSDASRDNVKRRFQQMLNDGIWVHKAPIGYMNYIIGYDAKGDPIKDIKIDDRYAHYVIQAFELRAQGMPFEVIGKTLIKEGFKTRAQKQPTKGFIERMLSNKFYYGTMVHNNQEFDHKYEPLISKRLYIQCQVVNKQRRHEKTKWDSLDYTFKKIVRCARCGRAVSPFKARNTVYLRCASGGTCGNPNTAESIVIGTVTNDIKKLSIPEVWIDKVIEELKSRHDHQQLYYTQNISRARKEYDKISDKIKLLYNDRLEGRIDAERYDEHVTELENRQQFLNDQLKLLTSNNKSFHITASYLLDLAQRAEKLFIESDELLKQKLLEFLLSNIELNNKKLTYILNEPFNTIANQNKKALSGHNSKFWCG